VLSGPHGFDGSLANLSDSVHLSPPEPTADHGGFILDSTKTIIRTGSSQGQASTCPKPALRILLAGSCRMRRDVPFSVPHPMSDPLAERHLRRR
jgi:hypothetical protein